MGLALLVGCAGVLPAVMERVTGCSAGFAAGAAALGAGVAAGVAAAVFTVSERGVAAGVSVGGLPILI